MQGEDTFKILKFSVFPQFFVVIGERSAYNRKELVKIGHFV